MVLFLGAGATQPFGPKTLQSSALMEKVFSVVENEFGSHIIANMKEKLRKHRLPLNFESIATIMEFFKNPRAPGSGRKVWWICNKGHEWKAFIYRRTSGTGCPYCAEKRKRAPV